MKTTFVIAAFSLVASLSFGAEQQTWTGQISDSACGKKHEEAAEGQGKMPDAECTEACVRGGSAYVLVVDGKVFKLANQTVSGLKENAGRSVKLTGELKGDTITVSKIEAAPGSDIQ